ncbi:MAG: MgtC/SapB family protein [Treponema sp.]|jgi:putative Mg2+ transporter-C (MgtC) family protein|nr:MgtC/SapB family protein [Treponema sp.]
MENFWNYFLDKTNVNVLPYGKIIVRIFLSFVVGFTLGLERKTRQRNIGLRTLILICVSSTVLMLLSIHMASLNPEKGDPARIAAQVVSGIGFLGGGAILRHGLNITGLTSAAIIWTAAALGMAIGAGMYIAAFLALLSCLIALVILEKFEIRYFPAERIKHLDVIFNSLECNLNKLETTIEAHGLIVGNKDISLNLETNKLHIIYSVRSPDNIDIHSLTKAIKQISELSEISFRD